MRTLANHNLDPGRLVGPPHVECDRRPDRIRPEPPEHIVRIADRLTAPSGHNIADVNPGALGGAIRVDLDDDRPSPPPAPGRTQEDTKVPARNRAFDR